MDQHHERPDADVVDAPGEGEQSQGGQVVNNLLLEVLEGRNQDSVDLLNLKRCYPCSPPRKPGRFD